VLLTTSRYEGGKLVEVRLVPRRLRASMERGPCRERAVPMTPSPEQAQRTLKLVQDLSKPFGTTISHRRQCGCDPRGANRNEALKRSAAGRVVKTCALLLAALVLCPMAEATDGRGSCLLGVFPAAAGHVVRGLFMTRCGTRGQKR